MSNENPTPITLTLEKFQNALPPQGKELGATILQVAEAINIDPCILAAVIAKESDFGATLRNECGDWVVRDKRFAGLKGMRTIEKRDEIPEGWAITEASGPWSIPEDGLGWKRGLMQIDWGSYRQWLEASNWRNPMINIAFGASRLMQAMEVFAKQGIHDPRYGIAAYDAGVAHVLMSMRPNTPSYDPDIVTTGRDYSAKVIELANTYKESIAQ